MFDSVQKRAKTAATIGIASALAVGGVAAAQGGGNGDSQGDGSGKAKRGKRGAHRMHHPPGPPGGLPMRNLTYAELHVQKDGEAAVIRLDRGKVVSTGESSITLRENDGNEVTIPVDEATKVLAGPRNRNASVTDLKKGRVVLVHRDEGGAAKAVIVPPPRNGKGRHQGSPHMQRGRQGGGPQQGQRGGPQGRQQGFLPPPPVRG